MRESASGPDPSEEETSSLPPPRLQAGDTVADRFVIVSCLARGGMGEVYEVVDLRLQGTHTALKTLRSDIARRPALRQRFEREVLLAREVHHPNVCPTYDLFHVTDSKGPLSFLTMKLLHGESLRARILRQGPLPPAMVADLATQLARGLDAAHRQGVVHRDLKPANIMLEEGRDGVHLSITDFGLSRAHDSEATLAEPGQLLGTPGYMAPEVFQGQAAGFPADIYAFGVVLYEMLTGQRPGEAHYPAPPSRLVPGLDASWDAIVMRCLAERPADRPPSAGAALGLTPSTDRISASSAPAAKPGVTARRLAPAALAVVALAATLGVYAKWDAIAHPLPARRFVALMAWPTDVNEAHRPLLRSALDGINGKLARAEAVTRDLMVIAPADTPGAAAFKAPTDAATLLSANLVLTAALADAPGGVDLRLAVLDAASGAPIRERTRRVASGGVAQLPDVAAGLAATLLDVTIPAGPWKDQDELAALPAPVYEEMTKAEDLAARPNNAGLEEAIATYQKVVDLAPRFALGYARLASAYSKQFQQTHDPAQLTIAARNADLALRFNPDSVSALLSRATVDLQMGNVDATLALLQRALAFDPGNPQVLTVKARAFRTLDRPKEEEATYRELVRTRPNFWPTYSELGLCLYRQARYDEAAKVFSEGLAVAPTSVNLLNNLGAMQMLLARRDDAQATYSRSIAARPTSIAYENLGTLAFSQRDYRKALDSYGEALKLIPREERIWRSMADTYAAMGDRAHSLEHYERGAGLVEEQVRVNPNRGETWMTLAYYRAKLGDGAAAEQALGRAETLGASAMPAQLKKVQVFALLGRREDALALLIDLRKKGLSEYDVELAVDLEDLRKDRRYVAATEPAATPSPTREAR